MLQRQLGVRERASPFMCDFVCVCVSVSFELTFSPLMPPNFYALDFSRSDVTSPAPSHHPSFFTGSYLRVC